jgi:phosphate transport system substrate-binding protein
MRYADKRTVTMSWLLLIGGALSGCNRHDAGAQTSAAAAGGLAGKISVDGSSTVLPISQAIARAFQQTNPSVEIAVQVSGTGGGFRKFCAGGIDIAGASRPIKETEAAQCKSQHIEFMELPIAFDALSVVVNAKNSFGCGSFRRHESRYLTSLSVDFAYPA